MSTIIPQKLMDAYMNRASRAKDIADKTGYSLGIIYRELNKLGLIQKKRNQPIHIPDKLVKDYVTGRITNVIFLAKKLNKSYVQISKRLKELGVLRSRSETSRLRYNVDPDRDNLILGMRNNGISLRVIGEKFKVSKQRIQQILVKLKGK